MAARLRRSPWSRVRFEQLGIALLRALPDMVKSGRHGRKCAESSASRRPSQKFEKQPHAKCKIGLFLQWAGGCHAIVHR
jgi:hypothetical protein